MWEEVSLHALQSLLHHGRHNPLVLLPDLWRDQVGVEISDHQKRPLYGPLANGCNNVFYCQGVLWDQVTPRNKPPPFARLQLKADDVRSVGLERLYGEFSDAL